MAKTESALAGPFPDSKVNLIAEESLRRVNDLMLSFSTGATLKEFLDKALEHILHVLRGEMAFILMVRGQNLTVELGRTNGGKLAADREDLLSVDLIERSSPEEVPPARRSGGQSLGRATLGADRSGDVTAIVPFHRLRAPGSPLRGESSLPKGGAAGACGSCSRSSTSSIDTSGSRASPQSPQA